VPGSTHSKTSEHYTVEATVTGEVYSLDEILDSYKDVNLPDDDIDVDSPVPTDLPDVMMVTNKMPMDLWQLFTVGVKDNAELSDKMWKFECELFRAGFTVPEVFVAVRQSKINKYSPALFGTPTASGGVRPYRPDPDGDLWREVNRAALKFRETDTKEVPIEESEERASEDIVGTVTRPSFLTPDERDIVANTRTFVDRYVAWSATRTDAAPEYARSLAYTVMSSTIGHCGVIPNEFGNTKLNLWLLVLGETTLSRKSTSRKLMMEVIHSVERKFGGDNFKIDLGSDFSPEGLKENLRTKERQSSVVTRDEVQGFFREAFTKSFMTGSLELLTDLYDGQISGTMRAGKRSVKERTEVALSLMFMGIDKEIPQVLTARDFRTGFLTRFLWVIAPPVQVTEDRLRIKMRDGDEAVWTADPMVDKFTNEIIRVMNKYKERPAVLRFDDEALERVNQWGISTYALAAANKNAENLIPVQQRLTHSITKAAGLLALMDGTETVTLKHVLYVIAQAEEWWYSMETMASQISASDYERKLDEIEKYIASGGEERRLESSVHNKFRGYAARDMRDMLDSLIQQGRIRRAGTSLVIRR